MRKFSWASLLFLSITTSSAYGLKKELPVVFKDGFYSAISFGVNWANANWSGTSSISLVDDIHDPNALFQSWTPHGKTHDGGKALGSVALGYQVVDARLYLGGQISYSLRGRQHFRLDETRTFSQVSPLGLPPPSTVSGSAHLQSKVSLSCNEFDIDLKPGVLILKNFVAYVRVGVAFTQLKIKNDGAQLEMNSENGLVIKALDSGHKTQNKTGFRIGAGTEYLITQHLGISLDYIYSYYGKIKVRSESQNDGPFDFNHVYGVFAPEVTVTSQTLAAGIVVHF